MADDDSAGERTGVTAGLAGIAVATGRTSLRVGALGGVVAAAVAVVVLVRRYSLAGERRPGVGRRARTVEAASAHALSDRLLGRSRGPYGTPLVAFADEPGRRAEEDARGPGS